MRYLIVVVGALSGLAVQAAPPASWLELANAETDIELADGSGYVLSGRWHWPENWFLGGRYSKSDFEINANGQQAEWEYLRVGVGYRAMLSPQTEWFGILSYDQVDLEVLEDEVESGENLEVGLSYGPSERLNLTGSVEFEKNNTTEINLFDEEFGFTLRGTYAFTSRFGLGLSYEKIDRFDEWRVGLLTSF